MKKIILFSFVITLAGMTSGQNLKESEVPTAVKNSFSKLFPSAAGVKWSKESASEFEAEFKVNKIEKSANFDQSGKWVGTETEISPSTLPQAVQATLSKEFPGYKIDEAENAETPDKGSFYEVGLKKEELIIEVQLSAEGKVLKKEEKKKGEKKN